MEYMNTTNHTLDEKRPPVKQVGYFVDKIDPNQIDRICDLYLEIYGSEPGRKGLDKIGGLSGFDAQVKIETLEMMLRIQTEDPTIPKGNNGLKSQCKKRVLKKYGLR